MSEQVYVTPELEERGGIHNLQYEQPSMIMTKRNNATWVPVI